MAQAADEASESGVQAIGMVDEQPLEDPTPTNQASGPAPADRPLRALGMETTALTPPTGADGTDDPPPAALSTTEPPDPSLSGTSTSAAAAPPTGVTAQGGVTAQAVGPPTDPGTPSTQSPTNNPTPTWTWNPSDPAGVTGATWTQATANAPWGQRTGMSYTAYNGLLWAMGGLESGTMQNDVWSSADGVTWTQVTTAAAWAGRYFSAAGMFWLSGLPVDGNYWKDVFPPLVIFASGMGLSFIGGTIAATNGVPSRDSGLVSGLLNTTQQVGGAVGLAILSVVAASGTKQFFEDIQSQPSQADQVNGLLAGFHDAFLVAVGLTIAAAIIALLFIRQPKGEKINADLTPGV